MCTAPRSRSSGPWGRGSSTWFTPARRLNQRYQRELPYLTMVIFSPRRYRSSPGVLRTLTTSPSCRVVDMVGHILTLSTPSSQLYSRTRIPGLGLWRLLTGAVLVSVPTYLLRKEERL